MGPRDGLVTSVGAELAGVVELIKIQSMRTHCLTDLQHWAPLYSVSYADSNPEVMLQKLRRGERAASAQVPSVVDKRRSARRWAAPYGRLAIAVGPPRGSREYTPARKAAVRQAWCFVSVWVGISVGEGVGISTDLFSLQAYQRRGVQTLAQITLPSITLSNDALPLHSSYSFAGWGPPSRPELEGWKQGSSRVASWSSLEGCSRLEDLSQSRGQQTGRATIVLRGRAIA